ncbi:MAG: ABC transporter ATP-binding protein [Ruminococcaceae bacterium]|nr:ABC transporter ATP-binding protein [Oscillospiraceae bacterium]
MAENKAPQQQMRMGPPGRPGGGPGRGPGMGMPKEKPKNSKKTIVRLLSYLGKSKALLIGMISMVLLMTLTQIISPMIQKEAIDCITITESQLHVDFEGLKKALVSMGIIYAFGVVFNFFQGWISATLSQQTVRKMRNDLFTKMSKLPVKYFDTHTHGELMSRLTNDVDNVSNTLSQSLSTLVSSALTIIGSLSMMLWYSPLMTLISLLAIPLGLWIVNLISKKTRKYFKRQQESLGDLNGHIEEMITGQKTVLAFSRTGIVIDEFDEINKKLRNYSISAQIWGGIVGPVMNMIGNISFTLVAISGGLLAANGVISVGTIQAFVQYSKQFTRPVSEVANQYAMIQSALSGAERVFEVMDTTPEEDAGRNNPFEVSEVKGNVVFENVNFGYNEEKMVLKDFSIDVKAGEKIALVGPTGAGKTTVVNLITRFYDINSGTITLDGVNLEELPKDGLRSSIGIVLQDTVLFTGTIRDNIRFGRLDATDEEIVAAAKMAYADEFISRLPDGYDTELSEQGSNLSQGQRQLLSIARAILADPKILILDEATSSIDTRTEMHIQQAMIALMKGRTSFIIAHRLSTIRDADMILVIDSGRIVEKGSHASLLKQDGHYKKLYDMQFSRT